MAASYIGHREIVLLLLEREAQIGYETHMGYTAMNQAATAGQCEVLQLLLDRKGDPNAESWTSPSTPLIKAKHETRTPKCPKA